MARCRQPSVQRTMWRGLNQVGAPRSFTVQSAVSGCSAPLLLMVRRRRGHVPQVTFITVTSGPIIIIGPSASAAPVIEGARTLHLPAAARYFFIIPGWHSNYCGTWALPEVSRPQQNGSLSGFLSRCLWKSTVVRALRGRCCPESFFGKAWKHDAVGADCRHDRARPFWSCVARVSPESCV